MQQKKQKGRRVGSAHVMNCFICRKYLQEDGNTAYIQTAWWCNNCHMPLCRADCHLDTAVRDSTCIEEHIDSTDADLGCFPNQQCGFHPTKIFPKHKQLAYPSLRKNNRLNKNN